MIRATTHHKQLFCFQSDLGGGGGMGRGSICQTITVFKQKGCRKGGRGAVLTKEYLFILGEVGGRAALEVGGVGPPHTKQ